MCLYAMYPMVLFAGHQECFSMAWRLRVGEER